jgi:hypothetical protein
MRKLMRGFAPTFTRYDYFVTPYTELLATTEGPGERSLGPLGHKAGPYFVRNTQGMYSKAAQPTVARCWGVTASCNT